MSIDSTTTVEGPPTGISLALADCSERGKSVEELAAPTPYTDEELAAATRQALDQHWVEGLARVRTWGASIAFIGMGLLLIPLTLIPQLQGLWRVGLGVIVLAMLLVYSAVIAAMWVWQRYDRFDHRQIYMLYAEGIATMTAGIALIYASGSAGSIFWLVIVAQLLNIAQRPRIRSFSLWLQGTGLSVLALLFVASGQWWDGLVVVFLGSICLWLLWIILDGQMAIVRGNAERNLLQQELQGMLITRERERIARDLHDGMGAELTSLILQARSLGADVLGEEQRVRLEHFEVQARDNLEELRSVVWSLQHDGTSYVELVGRLRRKCQALCSPPVVFELVDLGCTTEQAFPMEWAPHVLRIAQEAVRNAVRHGAPSHVRLTIGMDENGLRLEVVDDGRGLSPGDVATSKGGLSNMQKRAAALGGTLTIDDAAPGVRIQLLLHGPS